MAYLDRYAQACCSPFGAAEQRSRWWNKTPNLSERQRVFGVPPLARCDRHGHELAGESPAITLERREYVDEGKGARRNSHDLPEEG